MNKVDIIVLLFWAGMFCSCVSQKKYNNLIGENERLRSNYMILETRKEQEENIHAKWIRRFSDRNKELNEKNLILEREVNKHLRTGDKTSSECMPKANDSIGIYITFFSLDSAISSGEAMIQAHRKVEDSVKVVCGSVLTEAINRYTKATAEPFDTVALDDVLLKATIFVCSEVWKDAQDTYWAIEVQRVNWRDFTESYIAETSTIEAVHAEAINDLEHGLEAGKYEKSEFMNNLLKRERDIAKRKLDARLFKKILNTTIADKFK